MTFDLEKLQVMEAERRGRDMIERSRGEPRMRCGKCVKRAVPCRKCARPDDVLVKEQPRFVAHCYRCKVPLGRANGSGLQNTTGLCTKCQRNTGVRKGTKESHNKIPPDQEDQGVVFTRAERRRLERSKGSWSQCSCADCKAHRGKPMKQLSEAVVVCPKCNRSCESGLDKNPVNGPWVARDWQLMARYRVIGWVTCDECKTRRAT